MLFSKNAFERNPTNTLVFGNEPVKSVTEHKHLGVYLTSTLEWGVHIKNICLRANRKLSVLRKVKYLQRSTLDVLYKLTVRSVVDYCLPLFYNNLKATEVIQLKRLQYNAAKLNRSFT